MPADCWSAGVILYVMLACVILSLLTPLVVEPSIMGAEEVTRSITSQINRSPRTRHSHTGLRSSAMVVVTRASKNALFMGMLNSPITCGMI